MLRTELIRPVGDLLAAHAAERGGKQAFRDDDRAVTYEELHARTGRLAGHLGALGLEHGGCAAIYMDNAVEAVEAYLAIPRAGGLAAFVNPAASESEVAYMLGDSGAGILLTDPEHAERAVRLAREIDALEHVVVTRGDASSEAADFERLATTEPPAQPTDDLALDEPAWMLYTSGTTGRPKGVLLSQRSCLWVVAACWAPIVGLDADDELLSPLPLFHSYALDLSVLGVAAVGASGRILPRFRTEPVIEALRAEPFTLLAGVPTMYHYLLEGLGDGPLGARALRRCVSAGAIMPGPLNEALDEAFGVPVLDGYGITETSTMVTMSWPTGARPMGSCGLPVPGSTVRLVDPATGDETPGGEDGEVWVRGPHVMLGYHERERETAEALDGGWYHTGDLGRRDEHGYLSITGRIKELIIRGGENIYPAEVEEALVDCDAVLDCAVVGRADDRLGEVPVAFVVPRDGGLDAEAVLAHCRRRLAAYKVPAEVRPIDEIPRTGSGKVMRHRLRERL